MVGSIKKGSITMNKLEAICVTTNDERIVKMLKKKGVCEAVLLTDRIGMAYVPTEREKDNLSFFYYCKTAGDCQRLGKGIVVPLYDIIEADVEYALLNDDCVAIERVKPVNVYSEDKSIKHLRNSLEESLSRNELCDMLGIPVVSMTHWDNSNRKPSTYLTTLIECWLRSEGYLKRRFSFGLLTYDEDTTEYSDVLDWDWQGDDIYAETVEEAIDLALDYLLQSIRELNKEVFLSDLDDDDMIVYSDEYACDLYRRSDKPFTLGDGELLWGVKRTKNNRIEYYRIVEDDDDPKEYRCELARTVYFGAIHEHILED